MTTTATRPGAVRPRAEIAAKTLRTDRWWVYPLGIGAILAFFVVYSTIRIFMNRYYWVDYYHYLTPLYSPCLSKSCAPGASHFGTPLPEFPRWIPLGLAAFPIVAGFRVTCYYYRKAYYRSFWLAPAACAVPDAHTRYTGETRFPLLFQNLHRYAWYVAVVFIVLLTWDALLAFRFPMPDGTHRFGIGVGTLVMWANVILLGGYTFSCHSCRHVCGGHVDVFSRAPARYRIWTFFTRLNERHPTFAWLSLFSVGLTDLYIRLVAMGKITDLRIIF